MTDEQKERILDLANGYIEKRLTPSDVSELETILDEESEARQLYLDFLHNHAALHNHWVDDLPLQSVDDLEEEYQPRSLPSLWQTFAAAAVVCLLAMVIVRPAQPSADASFAIMQKTEAARWESGTLPTAEGARLGAGTLRLVRGLATIQFDSGAEVVLESPAELQLIDEMNCSLLAGTAVGDIPESAQGFTITTPSAKVIDHGTRFAVNVNPKQGTTRTEVFDGLVEVQLPDSNQSVELTAGQANSTKASELGDIVASVEEATWAKTSTAGLPGPDWTVITTKDKGCTDAYVLGGVSSGHDSSDLLLLKNAHSEKGPHRKVYLRFDLSETPLNSLEKATLQLRFAPTGWGLVSHLRDSEFSVYAMTEESLDDWSYETITWENAPANTIENGSELLPDLSKKLGTFSVPRGVQSGTFTLSNDALTDALNQDQNRIVTLVIVRETIESRSGGLVHSIASSRHPTLPAPRLLLKAQ